MFKVPKQNPGLCVGVGLLFLFAAVYVHQLPSRGATPISRLDLLHALAHGTVAIDDYHTNTIDEAQYEGHFYSDKAPGTVVLALPAFAASGLALRAVGIDLDSDTGWLFSSWIACAGSIAVITALGTSLMLSWLSNHVGPRAALVTTLAIFLGAAPLPYATMLFSHAVVIGLITTSLWAIARQEKHAGGVADCGAGAMDLLNGSPGREDRGVRRNKRQGWIFNNRWDLLAGFASGWALASEYTAGLVVVGLFLWLLSQGRHRAIPFAVAALPPLSLIPLYSWACFGNPFLLPYGLNASLPEMHQGFYSVKWPDANTAYCLLFSPARGLFFWTPFFVMAMFGYGKLARSDRPLFLLTYAIPVLQIVVISGRTWDWPAGPSLGPRYLAPIVPLLALPCALGTQRFPCLGRLLAAYSVFITTLATITNACPVEGYDNPLVELHLPLLAKGELSPNLLTNIGLSPYVSVALFYCGLIICVTWLWRKLPKREVTAKGN